MVWLIVSVILTIVAIGVIIGIIYYKNDDIKIENKKMVEDKIYKEKLYPNQTIIIKPKKLISKKYIFLGLLPLILSIFGCFTAIKTGYTGIVTVFGKVQDETLDAGMHTKWWWEQVTQMDNRNQKQTLELSCFSSDIQEVDVTYSINYQISKENASAIYKTIGVNYYETVMQPRIQEIVKGVIAEYTAETLVSNRDELSGKIFDKLLDNLKTYNIEVISANVENIDFTDAFTKAVEEKQVASQNKQKAIIEQEQKTYEQEQQAQRDKIKAEAEAEIAKIQANADKEVAQIGADSAEYQGKKDNAIVMQKLIALNGYHFDEDGETILDSDNQVVSADDLKTATQNLLLYYYIEQWGGELPTTYVGSSDFYEIFKSILANN